MMIAATMKSTRTKTWSRTTSFLSLALLCCRISASVAFPHDARGPVKETPEEPPPRPFKYSFAAGRAPGGKPDRYVEQQGDDKGVISGSYAYLDPNWKWQQVKYVADDDGFHVLEGSSPSDPEDTPAVARAKERHRHLFRTIADRHRVAKTRTRQSLPHPLETEAVKRKREEHAAQFQRIAEEHARIAAEQSRLSSLALQFGEIYD